MWASGFMLAITGLPRRALFLSQAFSKSSHVFGDMKPDFIYFDYTNEVFDAMLWIPRPFRMPLQKKKFIAYRMTPELVIYDDTSELVTQHIYGLLLFQSKGGTEGRIHNNLQGWRVILRCFKNSCTINTLFHENTHKRIFGIASLFRYEDTTLSKL